MFKDFFSFKKKWLTIFSKKPFLALVYLLVLFLIGFTGTFLIFSASLSLLPGWNEYTANTEVNPDDIRTAAENENNKDIESAWGITNDTKSPQYCNIKNGPGWMPKCDTKDLFAVWVYTSSTSGGNICADDEKPYLDEEDNCVECLDDKNCPDEKPFCIEDRNTCKACNNSKSKVCTNNQVCTSANNCVDCDTSTNKCPSDQACDTGTGLCAAKECASASDCKNGQACVGKLCIACTADTQCASGNICDTGRGQCVVGCKINGDCKDTSKAICHPDKNICVSGCEKTADCNDDKKICSGGGCVDKCKANTDCNDKICNTDTGECKACTGDPECGTGKKCSGGKCEAVVAGKCTGTPAANTEICTGDDGNVIEDTAVSLVSSCTDKKCEYQCKSEFSLVKDRCEKATCTIKGQNTDCANRICDGTKCVGCDDSTDSTKCKADFTCNGTTGVCIQNCTSETACGTKCMSGKIEKTGDFCSVSGQTCQSDGKCGTSSGSTCTPGSVCDLSSGKGVCNSSSKCVDCDTSTNPCPVCYTCGTDKKCAFEAKDKECTGGKCDGSGKCVSSGTTCIKGSVCTGSDAGKVCNSSNTCVDCADSTDPCPECYSCTSKKCVAKSSSTTCTGGTCDGKGVCSK